MRFRAVAISCILLLAAACQQAEQTEATADVSEKGSGIDPAAAAELRNGWIAAAERDDAAAVAAMYAEDAIFMTGDGATLNGRAAIEAGLAESFKANSGLTVTEESSEASGDVSYSTGQWQQKIATPDGKTVDAEGRYLVITKLQTDGTLKIVRHVSIIKPPATKS
jgi:uncharacterized protein (TIGR02246 family)